MKITLTSPAAELLEPSIDLSVPHHGEWELLESDAVEQFDSESGAPPFALLVKAPDNPNHQARLRAYLSKFAAEENIQVQVVPLFLLPTAPASPDLSILPSRVPPDLKLVVVANDERVSTEVQKLIVGLAANFAEDGKNLALDIRKEAAGDFVDGSHADGQAKMFVFGHVFELWADWMRASLKDLVFQTLAAEYGSRILVIDPGSFQNRTLQIAILPPGRA